MTPFLSPLRLEVDPAIAPIQTTSSTICAWLNVEFLGGYRASDFAPASHAHDASAVVSGTFSADRLGAGPIADKKALIGNGSTPTWRNLSIYDITDVTDFGASLTQTLDSAAARSLLNAAALSHTHATSAITSGTFAVERLGSGASSTTHVLAGNATSTSPGQWKLLNYTDVTNAVGNFGSTIGRIPYWSGSGQLSDSPLLVGGSSVTTDADFGTTGSVTCNDLIINYAAATNFKSSVYTKTKAIIQGSTSVTVTANDGAQTLTLTSSGGGSTPPTSPANAVYVWVVNASATGGNWYQLTGDNVYVA